MPTREPPPIDSLAARRFAVRAATRHPDRTDPLAREIEARMAERLALVRVEPTRVLDAGSGSTMVNESLRQRFPRAELVALDYVPTGPRTGRGIASLWSRAQRLVRADHTSVAVCADLTAVPIADGSCQVVWSNLALGAQHDPLPVFREWHRVLDAGGMLMFSTYGPDTLRELRAAFAVVDTLAHVHGFIDMHDLGDMLVSCGFAEPVMDMETITLTYGSVRHLVDDLRESGQLNALQERRRTLTGPRRWQAMIDRFERSADQGRVAASVEIVYGLAWKAAPRTARPGEAVIRFDRSRRNTNA